MRGDDHSKTRDKRIQREQGKRDVVQLACVIVSADGEHTKVEDTKSLSKTMTVRISGALSEFVASNVGENGTYENISEYVRDLIRHDKERTEQEAFHRLKGMRRLRPIEFRLAGCGDVRGWRAVGSSSGTTRRGPYAPSACWA